MLYEKSSTAIPFTSTLQHPSSETASEGVPTSGSSSPEQQQGCLSLMEISWVPIPSQVVIKATYLPEKESATTASITIVRDDSMFLIFFIVADAPNLSLIHSNRSNVAPISSIHSPFFDKLRIAKPIKNCQTGRGYKKEAGFASAKPASMLFYSPVLERLLAFGRDILSDFVYQPLKHLSWSELYERRNAIGHHVLNGLSPANRSG